MLDTGAKLVVLGMLVLAAIFGACITALIMQRRFDRDLAEDRELYYERERFGFTDELTAIIDDGMAVAAPPIHHDSGPIRTTPPTALEIRAARTQHGYIPDLDPLADIPDDDDAPTLITLTRTVVTESVTLPADHLDTDCDDAIREIRRRFDEIRAGIGSQLELVGSS